MKSPTENTGPLAATPNDQLRERIMSHSMPKAEHEHWAARHIERLEREAAEATALIAEYQSLSVEIVPGEHGGGEEVPASPAHLKSTIAYLQGEWDGAETRITGLSAQIALLREALLPVPLILEASKMVLIEHRKAHEQYHGEHEWRVVHDGIEYAQSKASDALAATPESASVELADLRKDRERLEWISSECPSHVIGDAIHFRIPRYAGTLRAAIDAAMQQEAKP